jgi:hypothetical protein
VEPSSCSSIFGFLFVRASVRQVLRAPIDFGFICSFSPSRAPVFSCWFAFLLASVLRPVFSPDPFPFVCFYRLVMVLVLSVYSVAEASLVRLLRHGFRLNAQVRRHSKISASAPSHASVPVLLGSSHVVVCSRHRFLSEFDLCARARDS